MNDYLTRTKKPLIVVAVECNHEGNERLKEYSPFSYANSSLGAIRGKGPTYMDWMVHVLKPEIDARYRTMPDREHTILCGSSMGGLMALYGAVAYNDVFQRAACLSPSVWVSPEKVRRMISGADMQSDTCIYMDYGSVEIYNHDCNLNGLISVTDLLLKRQVNLTFRIIPGGTHCEASWEQQIPIFMDCLGI